MSTKLVNTVVYTKMRISNIPKTYTSTFSIEGVSEGNRIKTTKLAMAFVDQVDSSLIKENLADVCSPADLQRMSTATALKLQSVLDSGPNVDLYLQRLTACDDCKHASRGMCTRRKAKFIADIAHCSLRRG